MNTRLPDALPCPMPSIQGFIILCAELGRIKQLLNNQVIVTSVPADGITHAHMLTTVHDMFVRTDPALSLFLTHPTRRLGAALIKGAADATAAVAWLAQNLPTGLAGPSVVDYEGCCERIQSGIHHYLLCVEVTGMLNDLDERAPETMH
jgi:hypothetical protein